MATTKTEGDNKYLELKHLGFVRIAAIHALVCVSNLYDYAKQNSGPLRSTVSAVENAVTTIVGPVYEKLKGVPDDLLVFVDKEVDVATDKFDMHVPPLAKQAVNRVQSFIQTTAQKVKIFANEAQTEGPRAALFYAAAECKQLLLNQSVKIWVRLDQFPPLHTVAELAVPTAAHWSEKYNHLVKDLAQKGHPLFGYLPLVPVDEIAKAYKQVGSGKKEDSPAEIKSDSDSDSD